jgi:hypothetical protein
MLTDPDWTIPPLPPGDGPLDRLRRAVARFADGPVHAARRAEVEAVLAGVDPDGLRAAAARDPRPVVVLAAALGVADPEAVAALVETVAAAWFPGTGEPAEADAAVVALLGMVDVVRLSVLVQAGGPVAAWVAAAGDGDLDRALRDRPPVPATRRWKDGETVAVPLAGAPFGAGPHRCPGAAHARALAEG